MASYPELTFSDDKDFNAELLNKAFENLNLRLKSVEGVSISYDAAVEVIRNYGLQRLNDALQPVYDELISISQIGVIFSAPTSTIQTLTTGSKTFIINSDRRLNFAPAAYLQIQSTDDTSKALYGATQSYDAKTGSLVVLVDQIRGIGSSPISSWNVSAAGTPDFTSSAHDLGVYTQAETDEAISNAVSNLRGSTPTSLNTLGKVVASLLSLTDGASLVSNFAQTSTAIANINSSLSSNSDSLASRVRVDLNQNLNQTQISQALSNLGVSGLIKSLLSSVNADAARSVINAQGNLGFTPVQQSGGSGQGANKIYIGWTGSSLAAQVDSTNLGKVWTDQNSSLSPGGVGYLRLPNGLIIQWGSNGGGGSADYYIPYPVSFSSGTLFATSTPVAMIDSNVSYSCIVDTPTASGIGVRRRRVGPDGVSSSAFSIFWMAIGV